MRNQFFAVTKLNGEKRSRSTSTGMKQSQSEKDALRLAHLNEKFVSFHISAQKSGQWPPPFPNYFAIPSNSVIAARFFAQFLESKKSRAAKTVRDHMIRFSFPF